MCLTQSKLGNTSEGLKVRVLQVIPKLGMGGAERITLDLAKYLDGDQFEVAILSLYPFTGEPFEMEAASHDIRVYYLKKRRGLDMSIFLQVLKVFCEFRPHIVHNHLYLLYTILPSIIWTKVTVRAHTIHNVAPKDVEGLHRIIQKVAYNYLHIIPVAISHFIHQSMIDCYGRIEAALIYNGVDTSQSILSENIREKWRAENGFSPDAKILVHIARFQRQKNHRMLINAFNAVVTACPDTELLLVGDGGLRKEIEELVREANLQNKVHFLGVRTDIPYILYASDLFVMSSDWEGLPVSMVEAMSAAKPVVATSVGGVSELVAQGKSGFLVPAGDAIQLAEHMITLCRNPKLAREMGAEGQRVAREKFDVREMARKYGELYRWHLTQRGRSNVSVDWER